MPEGGLKMANIALTPRCNLSCEYCFAHELTESESGDIKMEDFAYIVDFLEGEGEIGLIGGEPLLHKDINEFIEILNNRYYVNRVQIFTNGIFLDRLDKNVLSSKVSILVNVNSSKDIGKVAFEKVRKNIKDLLYYMPKSHLTLGVNIYKENQDFTDQVSLIKEFGFKRIRLSVVIPKEIKEGAIAYFSKMKSTLIALCKELKKLNVSPCYDCNAIPECVYTKKEKEFLNTLPFESEFEKRIFIGEASVCAPIVDIYPDKTATRCFGMSSYKVKIEDFKNINDLKNHFFLALDTKLVHKLSSKKCEGCYKQGVFGCFGGCLCYKEIL
jgi:MoaA/NifB/PqqE/SkfB family radical SAM enzyme